MKSIAKFGGYVAVVGDLRAKVSQLIGWIYHWICCLMWLIWTIIRPSQKRGSCCDVIDSR